MKLKNFTRQRHPHKIFKINLKTLIVSSLLSDKKDPRINPMVCFYTNVQLKLSKIQKITKNSLFFTVFVDF